MADWDAPPIQAPPGSAAYRYYKQTGAIPIGPVQNAPPSGSSPVDRGFVVNFWKGKGLSEDVAQGIADATHDESGIKGNPDLFNPTAINPTSGAVGLQQDLGPRKAQLQAQPNWQDPQVQLDNAYREVTGGDPQASAHWNEIKGAGTRQEAAALFKKYFERPESAKGGQATSAGWDAPTLKISGDGWNVSPQAIEHEQNIPNTVVVWVPPSDYLNLTPEQIAGEGSAKRQSLAKSLAANDNIEAIPTLDVKMGGKVATVIDQDGRNRALAAQKAGIDLIPVAIHGISPNVAPEQIKGMRGDLRPFDWKPVGKVAPTSSKPSFAYGTTAFADPYDALKQGLGGIFQGISEAALGGKSDPASAVPTQLQPQQPQPYTGNVLPLSLSAEGKLSPAVPGMISAPAQSMAEMGARALGQPVVGGPLAPLTPDQISTVAGLAGTPIAGMRDLGMAPQVSAAALGGRNPLAGTIPPRSPSVPPISPERAALAREAIDDFGIPLRVTQVGMNPTQKYAESAIRRLPFSGAGREDLETQRAFNRAVAKTFGEDVDAITQGVMARAKKRIGGVINEIENNNEIHLNNDVIRKLAGIEATAHSSLTAEEYNVVARQLGNLVRNLQKGGTISGETYGNLFKRGAPLDRVIDSSNRNLAYFGSQIKATMQDALQGSLSGEDLAAYKNARFEYKNMKTIEPLVNKSPQGDISPALLNNRVTQSFTNRAYDVAGANPLDRLAKIGQAFLKEPGSSGTSERGLAQYGLAKIGELGAAAAAGHFLGIPVALAGGAAALGGGRMIGNYLRNPSLVDRLLSRVLGPAGGVSGGQQLMQFASQLPATRSLLARSAIPSVAPFAVGGALNAAMLRNPPAAQPPGM